RRGVCRGYNDFYAQEYRPYADRFTVAGVIPMHTPEEAIADLEHCQEIGWRWVGMPEGVHRPIPEPDHSGVNPFLMPGQTHWYDWYGLDSVHDYDPVWAKALELGFAITFHGGLGDVPVGAFHSISNYSFNHIGTFAARMHVLVKSLFMGGVTRRFPDANIAV